MKWRRLRQREKQELRGQLQVCQSAVPCLRILQHLQRVRLHSQANLQGRRLFVPMGADGCYTWCGLNQAGVVRELQLSCNGSALLEAGQQYIARSPHEKPMCRIRSRKQKEAEIGVGHGTPQLPALQLKIV